MTTVPVIPQRPTRSQDLQMSVDAPGQPSVPPRPIRNSAKSRSRSRGDFAARSPLNDPLYRPPAYPAARSSRSNSNDNEGLQRPGISSLPLIGQEGFEYTSLDKVPTLGNDFQLPDSPNDTRKIADDLPLHAPRASVSASTSQQQVAPVVRSDSAKLAEAGLAVTEGDDDHEPEYALRKSASRTRDLRHVPSGLSREITNSSSRRSSVHEEEHGIPHIGLFVPMYPNAGDVQAPSPAPFNASSSTGVGFFNDSSRPATTESAHGRRRSTGGGFHAPPGSYGLHGHGLVPQDSLERAWYQKHPDQAGKYEGAYGPGAMMTRGEWALSSEQLNKLVEQNSGRESDVTESAIGVPSEAIGYKASEEYSSRVGSPALQPVRSRPQSVHHMSSPLRKTTSTDEEIDNDRIHLDAPGRHEGDKIGGGGYDPPTIDLGPRGGNTAERGGWINEHGAGTPILASDEIYKRPGYEHLHPAVSPESVRQSDSEYFSEYDSDSLPAWQRRKNSASGRSSRRHSRPSSMRQHHHDSETTGTPLNEIEEYEPLFKDGDDEPKRPLTAADKLKRPELERHRFPSQDIWEDTPNSLQLQTTVDGPQEPDDAEARSRLGHHAAATFESPEAEQARKGEVVESERQSFLQDTGRFAKPKFNAAVAQETQRPSLRQRFPSQDIWEDTPDSLRLETTVDPNQEMLTSPAGEKVPAQNSLAGAFAAADSSLAAPLAQESKPFVPARPVRKDQPSVPPRPAAKAVSPTERKAPGIPDRPKPQAPIRSARGSQDDATDAAPLSKTLSGGSASSADGLPSTQAKSKPPVPQRPLASSKFAAIKSSFMNDLNSRLQLGPQARKPAASAAEQTGDDAAPKEDKPPLADARKERARGPVRRKPGDAAAASATTSKPHVSWGFLPAQTTWHIPTIGESALEVAAAHSPSDMAAARVPDKAETAGLAKGDAPKLDSQDVVEPGAPLAAVSAADVPSASSTPPQVLPLTETRLEQGTPERTAGQDALTRPPPRKPSVSDAAAAPFDDEAADAAGLAGDAEAVTNTEAGAGVSVAEKAADAIAADSVNTLEAADQA